MANERILYGGKVERSTNGTTWAAMPSVHSLVMPETTREYHDVTSFDSPEGFREYITGLKNVSDVTISARYTSENYQQAYQDQESGNIIHYRFTLPKQSNQSTGDAFTMTGYPTVSVQSDDVGNPVEMQIVIKISGKPQFTLGTASSGSE